MFYFISRQNTEVFLALAVGCFHNFVIQYYAGYYFTFFYLKLASYNKCSHLVTYEIRTHQYSILYFGTRHRI